MSQRVSLCGMMLALALTACGGSEPPAPAGRDLLTRGETRCFEEFGKVVPGSEDFARHTFDGWRIDAQPGGAVAWALVAQARMRLPRLAAETTRLRLALRPPPGLARQALEVRLNDVVLTSLELAEEREFELEVPAERWQRGDNVLTLLGRDVGRDGEGDVFFGLTRVACDAAARRVTRSASGYELASGTGLEVRLELAADGVLHLTGSGEGTLELTLRTVDPWSGAPREPLRTLSIDGPTLALATPIPRASGTLALELVWKGASALELSRLTLSEPTPAARRSVLFVSIDTLAAQHLSLHGYARATAPELAAFARDAVWFQNCRANAPWTIPSYMAQFTGLLPGAHMLSRAEHPAHLFDPWELHQIAPNRWTLGEFFRAAGYRTAAFVDNPWLAHGFGFARGFDEYDIAATERELQDPEGGLRFTVPRVLAWLDGHAREEPFFLFVQAFDPHAPYTPVAPWKGRFAGDGRGAPEWKVPVGREQLVAYGCIPEHVARGAADGTLPPELPVAPIEAAYDEKVAEVDAGLRLLLDGLKARGLYDEILIVFSADHGESTTGHDLFFSHALLYNDVLHVPLVMRLPHGEHSGRTVGTLVQLVDLYPTLIEFVLGDPGRGLHGQSLIPLLRGDASAARGVGFAEWGMMEQASVEHDGWKLIATQPLFSRPQTQLTSPRLDRRRFGELCPPLATGFFSDAEISAALALHPAAKEFLTTSLAGPFFELYQLGADPLETRDLAREHPEQVTRLLEYLKTGRELSSSARANATFLAPAPALDAADVDELRALGYGGER